MGMIHLALGDLVQARSILQTGLTVDEGDLRAHMLLGCTYLQSGESGSAIAQWQNIPHFGDWRIVRGHMLRLQGNWAASNRDYYTVVQVKPSSYMYHMIGWNHAKLGQIIEAMVAYRKAIELGQSDDDNYVPEMSRLELAKLYIGQEDWYDAQKELDAIISKQPAMAEAYEQLGVVYYKGFSDLQTANRLLVRSIELDPDAVKSYLYLGSFSRAQKKYVAAEKWLRDGLALPLNMWTPWIHGELGRVFLEQEEYSEAISELEIVVTTIPTDAWYLELLGDAYRQLGKLDEANRYYQRALSLNSENERVKNKILALGDSRP